MKTFSNLNVKIQFLFCIVFIIFSSCRNDDSVLSEATFPSNGDVFIDGFSAGLNYASFGGAVPTAFQVDTEVTYANSESSMRFDVPNVGNPAGAYAGGTFFVDGGRNLSGFNTLTFWAKANSSVVIGEVGFGNDLGENKFVTSYNNLQVSSVWTKYYIPIPDPSKLTKEKGLFYFASGPVNGLGYSFWIDEVKFENLGTIKQSESAILNGLDQSITSYAGLTYPIDGLKSIFNLPNGTDMAVNASKRYFNFTSSNPTVASVDNNGIVSILGAGNAIITASLNGEASSGSLIINSLGTFSVAPVPTVNPANVISLFSDAYTNYPVEYYNGYWQPFQTTQSADFSVNGNNILSYTNFNFVGIQFSTPTLNATSMTHFHVDLYFPNPIQAGSNFKINIVDFGPDGAYGGNDDSNHVTTIPNSSLSSGNWIGIDIPFSAMPGLSSRSKLAQVIFEGTSISNFYADNIYLRN